MESTIATPDVKDALRVVLTAISNLSDEELDANIENLNSSEHATDPLLAYLHDILVNYRADFRGHDAHEAGV